LKIKNPDGDIIFQTSPVNNAPVPFAFTVNLPLEEGNYELEVRDDDTFGSETCGTVNFNRTTTGTLASGSLEVALDIIHPVTTIQTTDTVRVYELPEQPFVEPAPAVQACSGESVLLTVNYDDNLQWYRDTTLLFGENFPELMTDEPGNYWVSYTSPDGCKVESDAVNFTLLPLPAPPAFFNDKNLLRVNEPSLLPANHELQWLVNGVAVPGANGMEFCITEPGTQLYTLLVTDLDSGCKQEYSLGATYDPDFDCLTPVGEALSEIGIDVYPNPGPGQVFVEIQSESETILNITIFNGLGQAVEVEDITVVGRRRFEFDLGQYGEGLYLLTVAANGQVYTKKVIVQN
ncbi:MAG: T9SS C-terminal target domain-containing protein, partial [Gammaproteobacteria bacterium]